LVHPNFAGYKEMERIILSVLKLQNWQIKF
jgi:lysophospholipase L1-like esterase